MKIRHIKLTTIILGAVLMLTACSKDDDDNPQKEINSNTVVTTATNSKFKIESEFEDLKQCDTLY